ncbi:hypothetical protein BG003_001911 [Podila horticola]|nr:hypothetical protein BG003_001911 [Podila horticola]
MVFFMGAGHTDKSSHPGLQRNRASHALVGGKKKTGKKHSKAGGGSTSSKTQGSQTLYNKYGGAQDNIGPIIPIEGNTLGSWLAHLGSFGFTGAEKLAYKPIDIIAAMKELEKESETLHQRRTERRNSWSSMMGAMGFAGGESETHAPYKHLEGKHLGHLLGDTAAPVHESAAGAPEQRHAKESVTDKAMEDIIGPTEVQHEQDELGLDNQEQEDEDERLQRQEEEDMAAHLIALEEQSMAAAKVKTDSVKAKASSKKDTEESSDRPTYAAKVKTHMPGAFVEAHTNTAVDHDSQNELAATTTNHGKKQGPESDGGSAQSKSTVQMRTRTSRPESSKPKSVTASSSSAVPAEGSFGSRLWGYAQSSPFLKNVDSISGGLLGTAVATVGALANRAEAAKTLVKDNMPHKLTDLADDMKDSFLHAMKNDEDIKGLGAKSNGDSWDIRQALNKINTMHDTEHRQGASQGGLSFSVEDITVGPRSLQVPARADADEESELSDGEQEVNEALLHTPREPHENPQHGHRITVHPHDGSPSTTLHDGQSPEQYTIDAQGNKVLVADVRRDSGYDMLV